MGNRRMLVGSNEGTASGVKRGALVRVPLRSYDHPWYLQEKILAVPLVSCTIGKARCLCSFFQKLHSPLFGGQSRSRSRPCAEKGEKGEQRKGKGKAKQNTKYDSRTASRAWLEKENGTCIVMKCVSYSVYPYLQMLWKLTMDSALFLTTTKLKPPISYWT